MVLNTCCLRIVLCVLWIALPSALDAASVSGRITGADDSAPIPFASVLLTGTSDDGQQVRRGVFSSDSGLYVLDSLPAGSFELSVRHIGYRAQVRSVTLAAADRLVLDVLLETEAIEMEGLVVEADRPEEERRVQPGMLNLDAETLESVPAVGEPDPIRSLQLLPGVQSASDVSSGLYVRGGGPDQTLVLLDHVTVYNPTHAFGFFSTFNTDVIGDVTLYKGAYPAAHGGRLGSVLDVRTRERIASTIEGSLAISTIASRLTLEGPVGDHRFLLSGRRTYLDPILGLLRRSNPEIPSYYFYDLNARFDMSHADARTTWSGYTGRDDIFFDLDENTFIDIRWGNDIVSGTHRRILTPEWSVAASAGASVYESSTEVRLLATPIAVENRLREYFLSTDVNWHPTPETRLITGLQFSTYDFLYRQQFNVVESFDFRREPWELSAYADKQWRLDDLTTLRGGLRARYFDAGERVMLEPRLSASRVLDRVRIKFGAGIYHQVLQLITTEAFSAGDFYFPSDETVSPGQSWQLVTGAEWTVSPAWRLSAEVYYTDLDHLLVIDNTAPVDQNSLRATDLFYTDGDGYAAGVELFAERRQGALTGWVGYTLGTTRRRFAELNGGRGFPPKYDRRHDLNVVASYRRGPWKYGVSFVYATGQAFTPASARYNIYDPATDAPREGSLVLPGERNGARLLPYHRLDVSVTRKARIFGRPAEWYIQVSNLYNRRNEWFVQYADDVSEVEVVKQLPVIPSLGVQLEL